MAPLADRAAYNAYMREKNREYRARVKASEDRERAAEAQGGIIGDYRWITQHDPYTSDNPKQKRPQSVFPKVADKALLRQGKGKADTKRDKRNARDLALLDDAIHERIRWTEEREMLRTEALRAEMRELRDENRQLTERLANLEAVIRELGASGNRTYHMISEYVPRYESAPGESPVDA